MDEVMFEKIRDRIDTDDIDLRENYRRETYKLVKELVEDEEDDRLIMLKGMRKVGKTVILKQLTVDLDKTLYLDASVSEDLDCIVNYGYEIRQLIRKGEVKYLIIDEVSRIEDISKVRRLYDSCQSNYVKMIITSSANMTIYAINKDLSSNRCLIVTVPEFTFGEYLVLNGIIGEDEVQHEFMYYFNKYMNSSREVFDEFNRLFRVYTFKGSGIGDTGITNAESTEGIIGSLLVSKLDEDYLQVYRKHYAGIKSEHRTESEEKEAENSSDIKDRLMKVILYIAYKGMQDLAPQQFRVGPLEYKKEERSLVGLGITTRDKFEDSMNEYLMRQVEEAVKGMNAKSVFDTIDIVIKSSMGFLECKYKGLPESMIEMKVREAIDMLDDSTYCRINEYGVKTKGLDAFFEDWNVMLNETAVYGIIYKDLLNTLESNDAVEESIDGTILGEMAEVSMKSQYCRYMNIPFTVKKVKKKDAKRLIDGEVDYYSRKNNNKALGFEVTVKNKSSKSVHMDKLDKFDMLDMRICTSESSMRYDEKSGVYYIPYGIAAIAFGAMGFDDNKERIMINKRNYKLQSATIAYNYARKQAKDKETNKV